MAIGNVTRQMLMLEKGTVVATVSAANVVPPVLAPKPGTYWDILEYKGPDNLKGSVPEYMRAYSCHPSTTNQDKLELIDKCSDKLFKSLELSSIKS